MTAVENYLAGPAQIPELSEKNKIIFTHKALLKAGTITYKIRGMVHELETGARQQDDRLYMILFELRTDRIFGSVTLENIIENADGIKLLLNCEKLVMEQA